MNEIRRRWVAVNVVLTAGISAPLASVLRQFDDLLVPLDDDVETVRADVDAAPRLSV